jgi:hypothetical protein
MTLETSFPCHVAVLFFSMLPFSSATHLKKYVAAPLFTFFADPLAFLKKVKHFLPQIAFPTLGWGAHSGILPVYLASLNQTKDKQKNLLQRGL